MGGESAVLQHHVLVDVLGRKPRWGDGAHRLQYPHLQTIVSYEPFERKRVEKPYRELKGSRTLRRLFDVSESRDFWGV